MPTEEEYQARAQALDHPGLVALWGQVAARNTPGWESGKAFEYLILRAFELEGADVMYPYSVNMHDEVVEQIDGVVHADGISALVESKDFDDKRRVNIEPIAKLRNQLLRRPSSTIGMLFSRTGVTEPTRLLAQYLSPQTILIWDGPEIKHALENKKLRPALIVKLRVAIHRGQTDFNILTPGAL
jgi:hypothetical protein